MSPINNLIKHKVITDYFDYSELDSELKKKYEYFDNKFQELYREKAEVFKLKDCFFYIKNDMTCNAFATNPKGYNIIGITHGYAVQMIEIFGEEHFSLMIKNGLLKTDKLISDVYEKLTETDSLKLHEFMLDCSIQFTFGHEFQHILQFNSNKIAKHFHYSESLTNSSFDIQKHAWEFDADRFGAFEVLRFIHSTYQNPNIKNDDNLKLLLLLGLGSLFISKILFYLKVINLNKSPILQPFYTKENSHPHPLVRIINIAEYYQENAERLFPRLEIKMQEFINMSLWIVNIYLNSMFPNQRLIEQIFKELDLHLNEVNLYNNELYDYAIEDKSIKELLIARGINF